MIKDYFLTHKRLYIYLLVIHIILFSLFYLYRVSLDGLLYGLLLCGTLGFVFMSVDYYFYQKKAKQLERYVKQVTLAPYEMKNNLMPLEKEYMEIINQLYHEHQNLIHDTTKKQQEMMDYYSMWVHQIKTPIAAMHLLLQNNQASNLALENELFKIEQYVEMVLSYLRLDSEHSDYRFETVEIDYVIREVIHKYSRLFIQKKLTLNFEPTNYAFITDEKWFAFILEQLLSNAIKYTYQGGVHIYMENHILYIKDDGIGIEKEDLPRIFEKGYTGYNGRLDKKSTGIGLYLVKEVTKRLGIDISVISEINKGTTIVLNLELKKVEIE